MADDHCGVAQTMDLLGDPWTVLVLRDVARGRTRFEQLLGESGISRKVLAARLRTLEEAEVLSRVAYQERPVRYDYVLTERGRALLPVLVDDLGPYVPKLTVEKIDAGHFVPWEKPEAVVAAMRRWNI